MSIVETVSTAILSLDAQDVFLLPSVLVLRPATSLELSTVPIRVKWELVKAFAPPALIFPLVRPVQLAMLGSVRLASLSNKSILDLLLQE